MTSQSSREWSPDEAKLTELCVKWAGDRNINFFFIANELTGKFVDEVRHKKKKLIDKDLIPASVKEMSHKGRALSELSSLASAKSVFVGKESRFRDCLIANLLRLDSNLAEIVLRGPHGRIVGNDTSRLVRSF